VTPRSLAQTLGSVVGDDHVLVDDDLRRGFETDWTGRWSGPSALVVRPGATHEVAEVLIRCAAAGVDVIPQAGNTGLVGGSVPRAGDQARRPAVVLSLRRLNAIADVDAAAMQLTAGAGTTIADWQAAARAVGLDTPIDFAARDSATVGGAIATNAGGSRVLRYGTMRQQVVGIEAVLADGRVVGSLTGLPKETVGLHWPSILAGSEGTLAIVTAARLRLVPHFDHVVTAMISTPTVGAAIELAARLRRRVTSLDAIEIIQPEALRLVAAHLGRTPPIGVADDATVLLVECADHADPTDELLAELDGPGVTATAVATDAPHRVALVTFRDRLTEAINAASVDTGTPPFKLDVAVPLGAVEPLLDLAGDAARSDGCTLIAFGHLAEGNLHLNHLGVRDPDALADRVLRGVADLGGTISAEHGVGVAKTGWMHLVRTDDDLAAQAAIKSALDPLGMLNPGVLRARDRRRSTAAGQVP
jgi:FAD/FMN-containing dehydrogenase